jgi:hypothetical protein
MRGNDKVWSSTVAIIIMSKRDLIFLMRVSGQHHQPLSVFFINEPMGFCRENLQIENLDLVLDFEEASAQQKNDLSLSCNLPNKNWWNYYYHW